MGDLDNKTFFLASIIIVGWLVLVFMGKGDIAAFAVIAGNVVQHLFHMSKNGNGDIKLEDKEASEIKPIEAPKTGV